MNSQRVCVGAKEKGYTVGETDDTGASEAQTLLEHHPSLLLDRSVFLPGLSMVQGVCAVQRRRTHVMR